MSPIFLFLSSPTLLPSMQRKGLEYEEEDKLFLNMPLYKLLYLGTVQSSVIQRQLLC